MYNYNIVHDRIIDILISWEMFKVSSSNAIPDDELGQSPLSQSGFARQTWREYLPDCARNFAYGTGGYDYVKDMYHSQAKDFESVIAAVFEDLEQSGIIAVASPHEFGGNTAMFGLGRGGKHSHQYELTRKAAMFSTMDREGFLAMMNLPKGFASLSSSVESFIRSQGPYNKNIFLIMPFGNDQVLVEVRTSLTKMLKPLGFNLIRADDKEHEGGLWDNICVHMLGCSRGIAIFKEVKNVPYNQNVAIEIGFMLALRKHVLVLKDGALPTLPVDLIHHLYHTVDFSDLNSIEREVKEWI